MFAKLFGTDSKQVLVMLDASPSGTPELRIHFEVAGRGVTSVALNYPDTEAGWAQAEAAFAAMDEHESRTGVEHALRELGLSADAQR